jgi:predicted dehydrogenase
MATAAIIGCGSIATAHAYGFAAAGVDLVGLADIRKESVDDLADRAGVGAAGRFTDYRTMLDELRPDIVVVALWHGLHAEAVGAAASRGARVLLCEKPMAANLGEAEQMVVAARREGAKLAIAHQRRFYPGWSEARRLLADGVIGRPTHVRLEVRDGLLNSATHNVDLARFVLGDPATVSVTAAVQRSTDRYERGLRVEDSALAMIEVEGGTRIYLESDLDPTALISANAVVTGTDGLLAIQEDHVRVLHGASGGWETVAGAPFGTAAAEPEPVHPLAEPMYRLIAHFGTAVIDEFVANFVRQAESLVAWMDGDLDDHPGDARHGYAALEILMAIYESTRMHEVTRAPLATRVNPLDLLVESGHLPVVRPGAYDIRAGLVRGEG